MSTFTFAQHEWNLSSDDFYSIFQKHIGLPGLSGLRNLVTCEGKWQHKHGWIITATDYWIDTYSVVVTHKDHDNVSIEFLIEDGEIYQLYIYLSKDLASMMIAILPDPAGCTRLMDESEWSKYPYQSYTVYYRKGFSLFPNINHWKLRNNYAFIGYMNVSLESKEDGLETIFQKCNQEQWCIAHGIRSLSVGDVIMFNNTQECYMVMGQGFQKCS